MTTDTIEGEAVDVTPSAVVRIDSGVVPAQPGQALVAQADDPEAMIAVASRLASALKSIVDKQRLYATISGKKYPQVEAWATIGRLDNVVAREAALPVRHEDGSYEAEVELIRLSDGMVVGRASAVCGTPGDTPWTQRAEHNRRSMAVTRATSRAFRQQYSWIMALAGYEPTPADEMQDRPGNRPQSHGDDRDGYQGSDESSSAHVDSADAPADFRGKVLEAPLGIHRDASGRPALKFTMKVGNAKHHAIVVGPLAETVIAMDLKAEEPIVVTGVLGLVPWGDGTKPPMKHIEDVVRVVVKRDDAWVIKEAGASADPPASSSGSTSSPPPKHDAGATDEPEPEWSGTIPLDPSPAATATLVTPGTADDPSSASAGGLLELAAADTVAVKGTPGERISAFGVIATQEWRERGERGRMVLARVLADGGYVYQCAAPENVGRLQMLIDEATRDDQWRYAIGDRVRIIGTWAAGDIAVLTGIVRAPE